MILSKNKYETDNRSGPTVHSYLLSHVTGVSGQKDGDVPVRQFAKYQEGCG